MTSIKSEVENITDEIQEPVACIGPLNFNRQTKKVSTVRGVPLYLNEKEFDALHMLASREGETLTFEMLYAAVWGSAEGLNEVETARLTLSNLAGKVKDAGADFMWVEHKQKSGYTFKMRWRRNE